MSDFIAVLTAALVVMLILFKKIRSNIIFLKKRHYNTLDNVNEYYVNNNHMRYNYVKYNYININNMCNIMSNVI